MKERSHLSPEETLATAVVQSGLKYEGPNYALSQGGRWWLSIMGLDPEGVAERRRLQIVEEARIRAEREAKKAAKKCLEVS